MTRAAAFTQGDISKVLKGAKVAGLEVIRIEIEPNGKIVALFGKEGEPDAQPNEWDEVFLDKEKRPTARGNRVQRPS